jgi:hypothetical protein
MPGKITRVAVTYTVDTLEGPRHTFHGLAHMRRHIRPERLSELLDDLTVICEDLLAAREPNPANGLATVRERRTQITSEEAALLGSARVARAAAAGRGHVVDNGHDAGCGDGSGDGR